MAQAHGRHAVRSRVSRRTFSAQATSPSSTSPTASRRSRTAAFITTRPRSRGSCSPTGTSTSRPKEEGNRVISDGVAYTVADVMKGTLEYGTAAGQGIGCPAAGKTGTTEEQADAWFVGYTPHVSTAVWVGNPNERVALPGYGGQLAAPIWHDYMMVAATKPCDDFPTPQEPAELSSHYSEYTADPNADDPTDDDDDDRRGQARRRGRRRRHGDARRRRRRTTTPTSTRRAPARSRRRHPRRPAATPARRHGRRRRRQRRRSALSSSPERRERRVRADRGDPRAARRGWRAGRLGTPGARQRRRRGDRRRT